MKNILIVLLTSFLTQSALADLRAFQCRFKDFKDNQVVATLYMESAYMKRQQFMGLLELKVEAVQWREWPKIPAKIWNINFREDGKIASIQARFEADAKRAYLGVVDESGVTVQVDLSDRPEDQKPVPGVCDELTTPEPRDSTPPPSAG